MGGELEMMKLNLVGNRVGERNIRR
jgi:hypothetical protein